MTTEATIDGTIAGTMPAHAPIIRHAGRVLAIAGGLGIVGQLLFFDVGLGINFPVAISLLLVGGWLLRRNRPRPVVLPRAEVPVVPAARRPGLDAWQAWNAGRAAARDALEAAFSAGQLP